MVDQHFQLFLYIGSFVGAVILIFFGVLAWFLRDYVLRYHETLKVVFERIEGISTKREAAWHLQGEFCRRCFALVTQCIERVRTKTE